MAVLIRRTQRGPGREFPAGHVVVGLAGNVEAVLVQGGDGQLLAPASQQAAGVQALLTAAAAIGVTVFPAEGMTLAFLDAGDAPGSLFLDGALVFVDAAPVFLS